MRQYLPPPIFEDIQQHLIQEGNTAEAGWDAGEDEEDTLTGHLGARLQRDWSIPIHINNRIWRWRVQYKKFRGRGPGAFEKTSGADGIIQVEIDLIDEAESIFKGILFQAKKGDARTDRKITEQVEKMETMAPGGSAIFEYRPDHYRVIEGHGYLQELKDKAIVARDSNHRLGAYLGEEFLPCSAGLLGMYYDAMRKILIIPMDTGPPRMLKVNLHHRISVEVQRRNF